MPSVSSDGVETVRGTIVESGALDRPRLRVPDGTIPEGVVRVDADGGPYHAPVETDFGGEVELRGLYDNPRMARERDGENHLAAWVDDQGLETGRTALLDVVVEGEQYGLRAPGDSAVYRVVESPDDDLASIAEDLDG
ncbi:DUF7112 family protein [Natronomonas marina]|jgi:hypothetical protein|uniref:DUF7112 family protein n=1 Tax=Natronomonas marina TaxID=2961939 RepID=UPI0020C949A1|nr:hypothetical protein [Natronomonas marina]